jgi:hypothetical protein
MELIDLIVLHTSCRFIKIRGTVSLALVEKNQVVQNENIVCVCF